MEPRFENLGEGLLQGGDQIISIVIGTSNKKTAPLAFIFVWCFGCRAQDALCASLERGCQRQRRRESTVRAPFLVIPSCKWSRSGLPPPGTKGWCALYRSLPHRSIPAESMT